MKYNILTREGVLLISLKFYDDKLCKSFLKGFKKNRKLTVQEVK